MAPLLTYLTRFLGLGVFIINVTYIRRYVSPCIRFRRVKNIPFSLPHSFCLSLCLLYPSPIPPSIPPLSLPLPLPQSRLPSFSLNHPLSFPQSFPLSLSISFSLTLPLSVPRLPSLSQTIHIMLSFFGLFRFLSLCFIIIQLFRFVLLCFFILHLNLLLCFEVKQSKQIPLFRF